MLYEVITLDSRKVMLQAINDRIKGWLGIVVVVLIGLPFALWGIQSYLDDTGPRNNFV